MGHGDSSIFQTYYTSRFAPDVRAAFLGRPSDEKLFQLATHMSLRRDPRPKKEVQKQLQNWTCDSEEYRILNALYQKLRAKVVSHVVIDDSELLEKLARLKRKKDACKTKERYRAYQEAWKSFFDESGTLEIERQRSGTNAVPEDEIQPGYEMPKERAFLSCCLFEEPHEGDTFEERREKRIRCIKAMIGLCRQRDDLSNAARKSRKHAIKSVGERKECIGCEATEIQTESDSEVTIDSRSDIPEWASDSDASTIYDLNKFEEMVKSTRIRAAEFQDIATSPTQLPWPDEKVDVGTHTGIGKLHCPFCFYDPLNSFVRRTHTYGSKYNMWRHCLKQNIKYQNEHYPCPYPECQFQAIKEQEFKRHLQLKHDLHI
ncbi:hypothetical protein ABW20_dc0108381 [Dactylellina cionopaga]|nr:hypothetical protein ABW20_dc0108381 [Dactylellina cionopaga]